MYKNVKLPAKTMGNQHVKPDEKLNYINVEVSSLRYGIRNFKRGIPRETQQIQVQNLARYASEVNSLKGRVKSKNFSRTMENISRTMNDILSIPIQDPVLDSGAVETDSFIDVSINKRHSKSLTLMPTKRSKISQDTITKHVPTIKEIDGKFKSVKPQIILAIETKDSTQLRVLQQTIKVLATDLEIIDVAENTPVGDRKEKLVSLLTLFYQKISVALKDIRKSRDMDSAMQQKKNEAAIRQLEEIRQELERTDVLLTAAVKNEKPEYVQKCQKDLTSINTKLFAVETLEDSIKATKMQMVDKIAWLNNYANDSQKKGSQSDLTKAQSNYEDLIKEIASGTNKNNHELLIKFDSLGDFVNSIADNDESRVRQKTHLLNNIQATKSSMISRKNISGDNDKKGPKISSLSENIVILSNHWDAIETELKSGAILSEKDRKKIVAVLSKLQNSMSNARNKYLSSHRMKLGGKLNLSTPNLATSSPILKKFNSSLSVNIMPNSPIKARAKIYDLVVPKVSFIPEASQIEKLNNHPLAEDDIFSKMEEIKIQVNYIREKFSQIDDEKYIKNKLEYFKEALEKYLNDDNETIVNSVKLVLAEIHSLLRKINKLKRLKEIYLFGNFDTIQEDIERLRKIVNDYPEASKFYSFESLAKQLKCCEGFLSANTVLTMESREEMLSKFQSISKTLEKKTDIKLNLDSLKEKVKRFSGTYRGVLYNKLEKDLHRILVDSSEYVENKRLADEITRETEKQLKILENRASLAQSFRGSLPEISIMETGDKLNNLKMELDKIRNELQGIGTNDVHLLRRLRSRLDLLTLDLYQMKNFNENEEQLKILMYNDIDSLKSSVDAKIALGDNSSSSTIVQMGDKETKKKTEILEEVQEKLDQLKQEIEVFVGTTSDQKFYELDEYSLILVSRLEDMEVPKGTEMHRRKLQILKELYEYGNFLDKRAMETENLIQYERELDDINSNFEYYMKSTGDKMKEKLKQLESGLENNGFNEQLLSRKNKCIEQLKLLTHRITASHNSDYEEKTQKLENELGSLSRLILQTSTEDPITKTDQFNKLINLREKVNKLNPLDDKRKTNILQEIVKLQKIIQEKDLVQELQMKLSKIDAKVGNPITNENNSLQAELEKFHLELNESEVSQEAKTPIIQKYNDILNKLKKPISNDTYIGSTAFLRDLEQNSFKTFNTRENSIAKSIDASKKRIDEIAADISLFVDSETSENYRQLEDAILQENVILKKLNIPKDGTLNMKKIDLKRKIMHCLETLDERAQMREDLNSVERQTEELKVLIAGNISSQVRNELDEKLISLQVKLGQMTIDDRLNNDKLILANKIVELMKQLKDKPL